ncbi:hypothetical protein RclHR1_06080009 [Rhizophagus clarus]|uniref:SAM domain-containing protein n=1 Tax=Rhizophagus clarus TaxID=94130 RepID=A0A2Z6S7D3_9GLOM|nr:hypothetical protein RclHR1_06080009 [Rhizophagus clarus]
MSTSTAKHNSYLVENWDTETLINFLKEQNLKLNDKKHYDILSKQEVDGQIFLELTKEKLLASPYNFPGEPAIKLAKEIKALKKKPNCAFSSYLSLSEVLAEYGYDSDGIDSILLFSLPTYEIQDDNKVFKRCMKEILGRLRFYGILQPDSLEAIRNEYVMALLHASIHIIMDITNKELSIKPQYGIVGEESRDQVNAIKEAEELICIMEDKQHKVPIGFAQNIKQLESTCETNKKKRKHGDNDFDYLYGIVTTGRDWHFLLYSPGKISKASDTARDWNRLIENRQNIVKSIPRIDSEKFFTYYPT